MNEPKITKVNECIENANIFYLAVGSAAVIGLGYEVYTYFFKQEQQEVQQQVVELEKKILKHSSNKHTSLTKEKTLNGLYNAGLITLGAVGVSMAIQKLLKLSWSNTFDTEGSSISSSRWRRIVTC